MVGLCKFWLVMFWNWSLNFWVWREMFRNKSCLWSEPKKKGSLLQFFFVRRFSHLRIDQLFVVYQLLGEFFWPNIFLGRDSFCETLKVTPDEFFWYCEAKFYDWGGDIHSPLVYRKFSQAKVFRKEKGYDIFQHVEEKFLAEFDAAFEHTKNFWKPIS